MLSAKVKSKMYKSVVRPTMLYGNGGSDGKTDGKNGNCRVENGEMDSESDKKGHDKKRIYEMNCENCKAGRETSECKATLLWTYKKERRRLRGKKDDGDCGARHKEKRKAKEKWMDLVREDMERIGAREGDEVDRMKLRLLGRCGDPE